MVRRRWWGFAGLGLVASFACTDGDIQFSDRAAFNPPADAVSGMLGYLRAEDRLTTCGNCHVRSQGEWEGTAHSDAFATLTSSGEAQPFCYGCHTVSERGNALVDPAGWNAVNDDAYHDVQCENCHGPGLSHVENPGVTQPLPSLAVPIGLDNGCAECHAGNHHPFAEEWSQSKHATVTGFAADREECAACHRGQAALRAWGVRARYLEQESAEHLPITCGVCHDPHDASNTAQLRFPVETTSVQEHLCARCHDRRTVPEPGSSQGLRPHAPETALLLGEAGWFPPGLSVDPGDIITTHGSSANARLCATCHVNRFTVTDRETGAFQFQATGHLFTAIPCLDGDGLPTPGDCALTADERSFLGCASARCHVTEAAAATALTFAKQDIDRLGAELLSVLTQVDANLDAAGGEIDANDRTFTTAEGAFFNYNLAFFGGTSTAATHNPFLIEALLIGSLLEMEDEYGLRPLGASSVKWRDELQRVLDGVPGRP